MCKQITVAVVNPEEDCLYTDDDSESEKSNSESDSNSSSVDNQNSNDEKDSDDTDDDIKQKVNHNIFDKVFSGNFH